MTKREFLKHYVTNRSTIVAFGCSFILYIITLSPTVYNLDSAELTTAAATGGIARSTGYPLYLTLGWLWSWLPIGDVGYRLNLFSAFNGALTIALAEIILQKWQINLWARFGALGLLTCSTFFWFLSLIAEVYTLQTAIMAGLILALLYWSEKPTAFRFGCVGLMIGLGLSHHGATILLLPGCLWYLSCIIRTQLLSPYHYLSGLIGTIIGLSFYLYLPLRYAMSPAFNYAGHYDAAGFFKPVNLQTIDGLWWLVSGKTFSTIMFAYGWSDLVIQTTDFINHLWQAFFILGFGPGLLGAVIILRRNLALGIMLWLMLLGHSVFYINYNAIDKELMFLPTYLVWTLWLGVGYQSLFDLLSDNNYFFTSKKTQVFLQTVICITTLCALTWNAPRVSQADNWSSRTHGEQILNQLEANALIFGWWDVIPVIQYLQLVEGKRPDVLAINRFLISDTNMKNLIKQEINKRPVYLADSLLNSPRFIEIELSNSLYRLEPKD